jgi:hypothetical protein
MSGARLSSHTGAAPGAPRGYVRGLLGFHARGHTPLAESQSRSLRQAVSWTAAGAGREDTRPFFFFFFSHGCMAAVNVCEQLHDANEFAVAPDCRTDAGCPAQWASAHRLQCRASIGSPTGLPARPGDRVGHERPLPRGAPIEGAEETPRRAKAPASPGRLPRRAPARTWESSTSFWSSGLHRSRPRPAQLARNANGPATAFRPQWVNSPYVCRGATDPRLTCGTRRAIR